MVELIIVALKTQIHVTEMLLYEPATNDELSAGLSQTQRFEILWKCVKATRSMLEARFSHANGGDPPFNNLCSFDYAYAMLVTLKLSVLNLPGWDLRLVRREVDFDRYLLLQIEELKEYSALRSQGCGTDEARQAVGGGAGRPALGDPFVCLRDKLTHLRACIVTELAATIPADQPDISSDGGGVSGIPTDAATRHDMSAEGGSALSDKPVGDAPGIPMEINDDPFWQDLYRVGEWETTFSALLAWGYNDMVGSYDYWSTPGLGEDMRRMSQ